MAQRQPLTIVAGQIEQVQAGDNFGNRIIRNNASGTTAVRGQPVISDGDGSFDLANRASVANAKVIGLLAQGSVGNGSDGTIQVDGMFEASTTQWDAVTGGSGGLVAETYYYLGLTDGTLTSTPPSTAGEVYILVGIALNTILMRIVIGPQILL